MLDREYNEAIIKELFMEDGREKTLVTQICKKLVKGKSIPVIADEVEEPEEYVSKVCEIASKYLPNYDIEKIIAEL